MAITQGAASDYLEAALLEHLRGTALPLPSGFWIALHTASPTDAGTSSTEAPVARIAMGTLSAAWGALTSDANGAYFANAKEYASAASTGTSNVVVTYFGLWDAATGGNLWIYGELINPTTAASLPVTLAQGESCVLTAGSLRIYLASGYSAYTQGALRAHFSGTQVATPTALYIGLAGSDGVEFTTTAWPGYARASVGSPLSSALSSATDEAGGGKVISNTATISTPVNDGAAAVSVAEILLCDAASGGNILRRYTPPAAYTINVNSMRQFAPGALTIGAR